MAKPAKPPTRPALAPGAPPNDAEQRRLYETHSQLHRFVRVIATGKHAVELAPQPGCRLSIAVELDGEARRIRIIAGEIRPAPGG
jgi:hypothetical protein